jgi:putative DNA primase/helicase
MTMPQTRSSLDEFATSMLRVPARERNPPAPSPQQSDPEPTAGVLMLPRADELAPAPVQWLWGQRVALGNLVLIGGAAGSGKSTLATSIAAAVTTGAAWPCGGGSAPQGSVVIACEADSERDTVLRRLTAAGASREHVRLISGITAPGGRRPFNLRADLGLLANAIQVLGNVRLIVIDPIGTDRDGGDRLPALLDPLAVLAHKHNVAIVAVAQSPKGNYLDPSDVFIGTAALATAARAAFLLQADPADETRRLLVQVKNDLAADPGTLALRIEPREVEPGVTAAAIGWEPERVALTAREAVVRRTTFNSAKAEAEEFLRNLLGVKPAVRVQHIESEARAAGILKPRQPISQCRPLRDARLALKLKVTREGFGREGKWIWAMSNKSPAKI